MAQEIQSTHLAHDTAEQVASLHLGPPKEGSLNDLDFESDRALGTRGDTNERFDHLLRTRSESYLLGINFLYLCKTSKK